MTDSDIIALQTRLIIGLLRRFPNGAVLDEDWHKIDPEEFHIVVDRVTERVPILRGTHLIMVDKFKSMLRLVKERK